MHESVDVGSDGRIRAMRDGVTDLAPGFVDLQCNGAAGTSLADATPEAFARVGRALLAAGTTSWCPTLPSAPPELYPRFLDAAGTYDGAPRVIGVHLEGPFLNPRMRGAHPGEHLRSPDAGWLEQLFDAHPGLVRIVTLAPELPGALDLVRLCASRGIVASLGHTDATADEALAAIDAGATMLTHVFNAMRPIHHRDPGVAGVCLDDPRVTVGLICDGRHVDARIVRLVARAAGSLRTAVVSDAVAHPSEPPVLSGGFVLQDGALRNLQQWDVPREDALRMLTTTPADVVGACDAGRLEPGAWADAIRTSDGAVFVGGERVAP